MTGTSSHKDLLIISPNGDTSISGSLTATTKSFDIEHPTKENMRLRYGSLESPYHGVNLTGKSVTENGACVVSLPDYIYGLVKEEGVNIQLTNIRHGNILWVEDVDIENNTFTVKTRSKKGCEFFWSFVAIRKDIDDLVVEYEKD
jgi:hypothetical protein